MASYFYSVFEKIKLMLWSTPEERPTADTVQTTGSEAPVGPRPVDKRHSGDKPPPASLWRKFVLLAPRKRHRKEINMFPPAKVYAQGRHEIKTRHSKSATGDKPGQKRGGHDK